MTIRLFERGATVSQFAGQLGLSVETVSTYRQRLLEKMRLENNTELMGYVLERELS